MSALYGLVTICLFGIALAVVLPGTCPDMKSMPDFELSRFLGKWYVTNSYFEENWSNSNCIIIVFTAYNDSTVKFVSTQISFSTLRSLNIEGSLSQPNSTKPGQLVRYFLDGSRRDDFWILGTNYDDFAVTFNCDYKKPNHVQSAWILTRKPDPSDDVDERASKVVKEHTVNGKPFTDVQEKFCPSMMG